MSTHQKRHHTTSRIVAPTIQVYEQGARTFLTRWMARRQRPPGLLLRWMAALPHGAALLDLGCGGGQDAQVLWRKGYRVVGMDLTGAFLRIVRKKTPALSLVRADMRELPFRTGSFDGVWAAASLIHLPKTDAVRVLKKLSLIARPGAMLGATVTYGMKSGMLTKGWMPGRYFARWQKAELARAIERSGWTVESLRVVSNQERKGRWLNLIARRAGP